MKEYLQKRIELARYISTTPMASYGDVVLILTAVLSACAAWRWPGKRKDRKRFIRLLTEYSLPEHHVDWICIPALINDGILSESETPYHTDTCRIFTDEEIDLSPDNVRIKHPGIKEDQLHEYSYASLLYKYLRCGYAHEYKSDESMSPWPATNRANRISYIGRVDDNGNFIMREICFHLDYLFTLTQHHVSLLPIEKGIANRRQIHGKKEDSQ